MVMSLWPRFSGPPCTSIRTALPTVVTTGLNLSCGSSPRLLTNASFYHVRMPLPFHDCLNQNVNFKQICVQLRSLAVNVTLPAFAAERRAAAGATENARHENTGRSKCRTWKCETWKCGTNLQGWKMLEKLVWKAKVWKCLKVVVFVCRVIPSVQV